MKVLHRLRCFLGAMLLTLSVTGQAAVVHVVDGSGQLTGATGIEVNGEFYDVAFVDGTYTNTFVNGVPTFHPSESATDDFSIALRDQVYNGNTYFTNPDLTNGCEDITRCNILIPYELDGGDIYFGYFRIDPPDTEISDSDEGADEDLFGSDDETWGVFTLSAVAAVPEPSTYAMLFVGLMMLVGVSRRRNRV